ncbi:MAG: hypothetical protein WD872_07800, partial [Pirellulaceae bacterium]
VILRRTAAIDWQGLAAYAAILIATAVLSHVIIFGRRRVAAALALVALIVLVPSATSLILASEDWLRIGESVGVYLMIGLREPTDVPIIATLVAEYIAAQVVVLLLFRMAMLPGRIAWRNLTGAALAVMAVPALGMLAIVYGQMLWLPPLPPPLTSESNHYQRIVAIAAGVYAISPDPVAIADLRRADPQSPAADRMEALYAEVLPLLEAPNFVELPPPDETNGHGYSMALDSMQASRALARGIHAEAKDALAKGKLERGSDWSLANIRVGTMLKRDGSTVHFLVGIALEGMGLAPLIAHRHQLDPATARKVIAALDRSLAERQTMETVRLRDAAYWDRAGGWAIRFTSVLTNLRNEPTDPSAELAEWRSITVARLLQTDLAIRLYRHDQGRPPDRLDDLAPRYLSAVPLDPFSGQPLVYRPGTYSFVLYSVGQDGVDNGGHFGNQSQYHGSAGHDLDLETLTRP